MYLDHGTKPIGGGQINTLSLIRSLDRNRFTPVLLSGLENAFTQSARENGVEVVILSLPAVLTQLGRWSVKYDPFHLTHYAWHYVSSARAVARVAATHRADILHPCDNVMRMLSVLAAWQCRMPIVCPIMEEFTASATSRFLRWLYLRTMDYLLPVSERAAEFFRQGGQHKARVVVTYTGIDLDQFAGRMVPDRRGARAARDGEAIVFGIVGRLVAIKGHRDLFHALAAFKRETLCPFRCLVVGDGPDRQPLEQLVADLGLTGEIEFVGFRRDVAAVMSTMHVVVAPSHNEASSRVVLEAGALGLAVVATRVGGIPEMVQDEVTGLLVDVGDVNELAAALKKLTDESVRSRMGAAGLDHVRSGFSSTVITRRVEDIYLSALSS